MKLLVETISEGIQIIKEGSTGSLFLEGPHVNMNVRNGNGRLYEEKRVVPKIEKFITEWVDRNRALGELNHPNSPKVDPKEAAIMCTQLISEGNDYLGKSKILPSTANGRLIEGLINDGVAFGVSTRALGTVDKNKSVNEDFDLRAIDAVIDPSGPTAFTNAIMEDVDWVYDAISKSWKPMTVVEEKTGRIIEEVKKSGHAGTLDEQKALAAFRKFIKAI